MIVGPFVLPVCLSKMSSPCCRSTSHLKSPAQVSSKDVILYIISKIGTAGGTNHAIEFAGPVFANMSIEARMTVCNMAIEAGAQIGLMQPDEKAFSYLKNRPLAPAGKDWDSAIEYWKGELFSDDGAVFDKESVFEGSDIAPQVTWGTSPEDTVGIGGRIPTSAEMDAKDPSGNKTKNLKRALQYMGLAEGQVGERGGGFFWTGGGDGGRRYVACSGQQELNKGPE